MKRFLVLLVTAAAFFLVIPGNASPAYTSALPGPYVTFLFSRAEQVPAINCVPDTTGIVPLNSGVAPYMNSLGLRGTLTVDSLHTTDSEGCTHNINGTGTGESITSSWSDLQYLTNNYGWSSTEHLYLNPYALSHLSPAQAQQDTCGQIPILNSEGLTGTNGMISYPGAQSVQTGLQTNDGQTCFAWGRKYNKIGITPVSAAFVSPYWQSTHSLSGGPGKGSSTYTNPQAVISEMQNLQPGQWLTIQAYLLVTGTNPPGDSITWSCDQPGIPNTSNDVERYCYSDAQLVMQAAANMQNQGMLTVTDPLTVANAFGRSGF